jgi:hypothetical protein
MGWDSAWRAWGFAHTGPTVTGMGIRYASAAYRDLGRMLRRVREQAGLSGVELSRLMGWPLTKISRMEQEQLLHLVLTAALDNVTLRIVPSAAGSCGDAFRLMEFHEHRPVVYLGPG